MTGMRAHTQTTLAEQHKAADGLPACMRAYFYVPVRIVCRAVSDDRAAGSN